MATTLNHEIASLVDCTRELVRTILSKQQPYYPVEVRVDCNDGNLSGVLFAKTLIQLCTQRIEEMVLDIYRVLLDSGYCGIRSFVTRVAGPISLIHCRNDVINSVAYIKKRNCELEREAMAFSGCSVVNTQYGSKLRLRLRQRDYSKVSSLSTQNRDTTEDLQQDMTFLRCDRSDAYICELESELRNKDMLITLITGLVRDRCPRMDEIINQYQHQLNHTEDQQRYKRIDELTERIQVLETENNDLQSIWKQCELQLKECQTKTGELEKEAVGLKQRLKLKDEELITMKKEKEDLLTRNGQLIKEAMGFKQRTEKEKGELLARTGELIKEAMGFKQRIEKEKGELYARTGELEKEAVGLKQRLDLKDEKLLVIQKEREELSRWNDVLEKEVFEFKQRRHLRDEELIAIKKRKAELLVRTEELEKEVTIFKQMLNFKEEELIAINQQKEDLLTRLSQYTSAQMVHDNPNVADLSDLNRPTKLAEKLSELYDNEWTDGFEVLTENYKFTETDAIQQLLDILMDAYKYCTNISNKQAEMMKQALLSPVADYTGEDQQTELNNVQLRNIFDLRKQTSHRSLTTVQKGFLDNIRISGQKSTDVTQIIKYINQCVELCWHMVIRSPPLVFEAPASKGSEFDKTKYRFYQTSGTNLKFIVWPVLRLHKNGSLLSKGIAEAMKGDAVLTADLN